jgi:hypothetical protein
MRARPLAIANTNTNDEGHHIGEFEELVLIAARGLGRDAYGVSVQQLLERETTRSVSLGAAAERTLLLTRAAEQVG